MASRLDVSLPTLEAGDTFLSDARAYLELVRDMPSFTDRKRDIEAWAEVFGRRPRATVTAREIQLQLDRWKRNGRADGRPMSPSTLNHRRTALMHLYTRLDGRSAANPVKDVPPYDEGDDDEVFRSLDYGLIYRLLALVEKGSQTRARLRLMAWTGWPHAIMMRLRPEDIDPGQRRVYIRRRRKGKGMKGRWIPLLPPAWRALEEFIRLNCWGTFSQPSMRKSLLRAAEKLTAHRRRFDPAAPAIVVTPYHLRHSFGTLAALIVRDDRALEELLMTKKIRRYTEAATSPRLSGAIATLASALQDSAALSSHRSAVGAALLPRGNFGNFPDGNRGKARDSETSQTVRRSLGKSPEILGKSRDSEGI